MRAFIVERNLVRGPRPESMEILAQKQVKHLVSLQSGVYQLLHEDKFERQFPADYGITFWDLGCSDIWPPERWAVDKFLQICKNANVKDEIVYVHCKSGVDRTGFMVACYRMFVQGWSYEDAYTEWVTMGRHWWFDWWKDALQQIRFQIIPPREVIK